MRKERRKVSVPTTIVRMKKYILLVTVMIFSLFSFLVSAGAMQFDFGPDTKMECDVIMTYGGAMRASGTDQKKIVNINTDDANRNFDQWDLVNNKFATYADINIEHKNAGLFVRPKAFYDSVYMGHNANNSPGSNNALQGRLIDSSNKWAEDVEEIHGRNAEILDLFGYYNGRLIDRALSLRLGKQVISWGESFLIPGMASSQSPMDISAAVAVGTEVKEMYLPTEAAFLQMDIVPSVALAGYYQWKWEKSRLMEGGTFFSRADMLEEIKAPMLVDIGQYIPPYRPMGPPYLTIPRTPDQEARDDGQYGLTLTWVTPWFNATEVGLYFINYHDKNPLLLTAAPSSVNRLGTYYLKFVEDIKLYGVSVSSSIGVASVSGEFSYRQDVGIAKGSAVEIGDYWQAQGSILSVYPLHVFADQFTLMGEIACGKEVNFKQNEFAWAYSVKGTFGWISVFEKVDFNLNLATSNVPDGSSRSLPLGTEDSGAVSIGVEAVYDFNLKGALTYENRFDQNPLADRDTISLKVSYSF